MAPKADKGKGPADGSRKRARGAGGGRDGGGAASDEQLVRRLTREALEELVMASLEHGEAVTRADVEAKAAPEQARTRARARKSRPRFFVLVFLNRRRLVTLTRTHPVAR